jgi:NADP-dependent aldehyde dehydrogenase
MITGKNFIGNVLSATGLTTFKTFNPKQNIENEYVFVEASKAEIEVAVSLAKEAFKEYREISGNKKSAFLNEIANQILILDDALIEIYGKESGLTKERAISERGRTIFQLKSFANLVKEGSWVKAIIETADVERKPIPKVDLRKMLIPLGPVVVFGASNFPLAYSTAGGDTAAALASGCPVIVKSHPMHAGTGELVAKAIIKAAEITGMPNGVFSNLNSSGIEVGTILVKHPQIKAVGFTGSVQGGRALFNLASQRPKPIPVFAEMGSVNPVILLPKALQNNYVKWAKLYADSVTLGSGQFCTNPGLMLGIKSPELNNFIKVLAKEISKREPTCMLHPTIYQSFETKKEIASIQKGVDVVTKDSKNNVQNFGRPSVLTVDGEQFLKNPNLHHEVFGPFTLIVQCENENQLEEIISNLEGQLTGTILNDLDEALNFKNIVDALKNRVGRIIFNGVPTGVEVCEAMQHGGPYPASTDSRFTAVGVQSINRWVRPISYQNWPNNLLPDALKNENPLNISRSINGKISNKKINS